MSSCHKSTVEQIRQRFDGDVERFSSLQSGQVATVDAPLCMELVAAAAAAATPHATTALDIGCGAGNYSLKLRERLPQLKFTLADLSQPMLERAKLRLGESIAAVRQGDVREMEFPDGAFDIIVAAAVFHHLRSPTEWTRMFERLHAWLRPGGGVWIFDLVSHESEAIQALMWTRYGEYLEGVGGGVYREKVFRYIEEEDTPTPLSYQLELLRQVGFQHVDVLHKNACFAAWGGRKAK